MKIYDFVMDKITKTFLEELQGRIKCQFIIKEVENFGKYGSINILEYPPEIKIDKNAKNKENIIFHEAFHLKLKLDGLPHFEINKNGTGFPLDDLKGIVTAFYDKVEHYFFFSDMEKIGIDPYSDAKKRHLEAKVIDKSKLNSKEVAAILFQTWIEIRDPDYLEKLINEFKEYGYVMGVQDGLFIIDLIEKNKGLTFLDSIVIFKQIFEQIYSGYKINIEEDGSVKFKGYEIKKVKLLLSR